MSIGNLDLVVDVSKGVLLSSFDSTARLPTTPKFVFGDQAPVSVRLVEPSGINSTPWRELDLTGKTINVSVGELGGVPDGGTFTLTYGGDTTAAIDYNATASAISTIINALASITSAGGVTVTSAAAGSYRITFVTNGVRTDFTSNTTPLSPTIYSYIAEAQTGTASIQEVVLIRLQTQPACYLALPDNLPVAAITVVEERAGASGVSEIQSLTLNPIPYDGSYTITVGGDESTSLVYNSTAAEIQAALVALTAVGAGNAVVTGEFPYYTVTFAASLGNIGAMSGDVSALVVPQGRAGDLDINVPGVAEILAGKTSAEVTLDISVEDDGSSDIWTPLQTKAIFAYKLTQI